MSLINNPNHSSELINNFFSNMKKPIFGFPAYNTDIWNK